MYAGGYKKLDTEAGKMSNNNDNGGEQGRPGNLNVIPTQATGDVDGNQGITSYIEYNDGKVCWYYPIFPDVQDSVANSQERVSIRYAEEENDDYFYEEADLPVSATNTGGSYGDFIWERGDYRYGDDWQGRMGSGPDPLVNAQPEPQNYSLLQEYTNQHFYNHSLLYGTTDLERNCAEFNNPSER